jgi:hypothetical protein
MKAPRFFDEGIFRAAPNFGLHSFLSTGHTPIGGFSHGRLFLFFSFPPSLKA